MIYKSYVFGLDFYLVFRGCWMIGYFFLCDVIFGYSVILYCFYFIRFSFVCGGMDCIVNWLK